MIDSFRKFCNPGMEFCFEAPSNWEVSYHSDYPHMLQVVNPENGASVTASGYKGIPENDLRGFADTRFESHEDFLTPVDSEQPFENGFYIELEGIYPGESEPTYYVIGVIGLEAIYISFSIVTIRDEFEKNRNNYIKLMKSTVAHQISDR